MDHLRGAIDHRLIGNIKGNPTSMMKIALDWLRSRGDARAGALVGALVPSRRRDKASRQQRPELLADGLLRSVSHSLNGAWSRIMGAAQSTDEWAHPDEVRETMDRIVRSSQSGLLYTRALAEIARRELGRSEVLDPGVALQEWTDLLTRTLGEEIDVSFIPPLMASRVQFDRIYFDLVMLDTITVLMESDAHRRWLIAGATMVPSGNRGGAVYDHVDVIVIHSLPSAGRGGAPHPDMSGRQSKKLAEAAGGCLTVKTVNGVGMRVQLRLPLAAMDAGPDSTSVAPEG